MVCFGLCCAALWCEFVGVVVECIGLFRLLSVCREIAKIIKSVMAITELKKNGSKKEIQARSKLLKPLELLGFALVSFGCCFGISWLCCRGV